MKKITLATYLTLCLLTNLLNSQTITEFSTGYNSLEGIAINSNNEVYVSERDSGKIFKIDSLGMETLIETAGGFAHDMVFDLNNNLYITEPFTDKISVIDNATGIKSTHISTNGIGSSPYGVAFYNNLLYFSSENNAKVIRINEDLTTAEYATDFFTPEGIAFDAIGNLYVADRNERKLLKITPDGVRSIIASNIKNIRGVAVSPKNDIYFTMHNEFPLENKIIKYDPIMNTITDFVTTMLNQPRALEIDNIGNMYVTNLGDGKVIKIFDESLKPLPTINIPDNNFKTVLLNNTSINTNGDNDIQVFEAENYSGEIDVIDKEITDLTGIEGFKNITILRCQNNAITNLDVSQNTKLLVLECGKNQLISLDLSENTNLWGVSCSNNLLTNLTLNASSSLSSLICRNNKLSALNLANYSLLETLWCNDNNLTMLNVTGNSSLNRFRCSSNKLQVLDISTNINLKYLEFDGNQITNIDTSNNLLLETINGSRNNLGNIDITLNTALKSIAYFQTGLTTLDVSKNIDLEEISITNNQLENLDVTNNVNLKRLFVNRNLLSTINLTNNNLLTNLQIADNKFTEINLTSNRNLTSLFAYNNNLTQLDLSQNPELSVLYCYDNNLETLNIKNGNNMNISSNLFRAENNSNLSCILVDDKMYSSNNWLNIDTVSTFIEEETECPTTLSNSNFRETDLKIYPNPTSNYIRISIPYKKITIYTIQGKEILSSSAPNINIKNLHKGMYLIKIEAQNSNTYTNKLIKK